MEITSPRSSLTPKNITNIGISFSNITLPLHHQREPFITRTATPFSPPALSIHHDVTDLFLCSSETTLYYIQYIGHGRVCRAIPCHAMPYHACIYRCTCAELALPCMCSGACSGLLLGSLLFLSHSFSNFRPSPSEPPQLASLAGSRRFGNLATAID